MIAVSADNILREASASSVVMCAGKRELSQMAVLQPLHTVDVNLGYFTVGALLVSALKKVLNPSEI